MLTTRPLTNDVIYNVQCNVQISNSSRAKLCYVEIMTYDELTIVM